MIQEYITDICNLLNIKVPSISFDTSNFTTKTMKAQCNSDGTIIFLNKTDKPDPDYMFAIAHELRHIWQIRTNRDFYFASYKTIDLCSSVEEYNLQIAEVDANAFAAIIMVDCFRLNPQWNGLSDKVIAAIENRINTIVHSLE